MDSKLEAGYLAKLFTEPVYLLGYETEEKSSVVNKDLKAESSVLKQENKKIPVIPELPNHSPKISKKCILLYSSEEE